MLYTCVLLAKRRTSQRLRVHMRKGIDLLPTDIAAVRFLATRQQLIHLNSQIEWKLSSVYSIQWYVVSSERPLGCNIGLPRQIDSSFRETFTYMCRTTRTRTGFGRPIRHLEKVVLDTTSVVPSTLDNSTTSRCHLDWVSCGCQILRPTDGSWMWLT